MLFLGQRSHEAFGPPVPHGWQRQGAELGVGRSPWQTITRHPCVSPVSPAELEGSHRQGREWQRTQCPHAAAGTARRDRLTAQPARGRLGGLGDRGSGSRRACPAPGAAMLPPPVTPAEGLPPEPAGGGVAPARLQSAVRVPGEGGGGADNGDGILGSPGEKSVPSAPGGEHELAKFDGDGGGLRPPGTEG